MADLHIKVGGAWKAIDAAHVKVGGAWKDVKKAYVKVGGAWKEAWASGVVTLSGHAVTALATDPANATAAIRIDDDGKMYQNNGSGYTQIDASTDWVIPHSAAPGAYEARYTGLTGDAMTSQTAAEDTWFALSGGDFTLTLVQATTGSKSNSFTLEIRDGSSGAAIATGSYSLSATVSL